MNSIHDDDKFKTLHKVLRSLPKLRASDNFEIRLRQRITQTGKIQGKLYEHHRPLRVVPSFAYSSIAVGILVVLIYYLISENRVGPVVQTPTTIEHQGQMQISGPKTTSTQDNKTVIAGEEKKYAHIKSTGVKKTAVEVFPMEKNISAGDVKAGQSSQSMISSISGGSTNPSPPESNPTGTARSQNGLVIDQKNTTTGILELKRGDTTDRDGSKSRPIVPRVKDALGVGVVGHGISSALSDSLKTDSLKRIKKQLFIPKAIEKKQKE